MDVNEKASNVGGSKMEVEQEPQASEEQLPATNVASQGAVAAEDTEKVPSSTEGAIKETLSKTSAAGPEPDTEDVVKTEPDNEAPEDVNEGQETPDGANVAAESQPQNGSQPTEDADAAPAPGSGDKQPPLADDDALAPTNATATPDDAAAAAAPADATTDSADAAAVPVDADAAAAPADADSAAAPADADSAAAPADADSAAVPADADSAAAPADADSAAAPADADSAAVPADADAIATTEGEEKAPELVKVVHSARSVFRVRDQKEYDPFTAQLERRITKLFDALDTEGTGRVDVQELGTLVRSVGCCPSESDLQEMVTQLEEEGQPGLIRLETVMPYIIQCVEDRKYPSASVEQLLQAFEVLAEEREDETPRPGPAKSAEKREEEEGTMPQDKLVHILTEEGEHFSQEEVEEMLSVVPATDTARVDYTEFVKQLTVPELW